MLKEKWSNKIYNEIEGFFFFTTFTLLVVLLHNSNHFFWIMTTFLCTKKRNLCINSPERELRALSSYQTTSATPKRFFYKDCFTKYNNYFSSVLSQQIRMDYPRWDKYDIRLDRKEDKSITFVFFFVFFQYRSYVRFIRLTFCYFGESFVVKRIIVIFISYVCFLEYRYM